MAISRRKAREAALQALYEIEIGHTPTNTAVRRVIKEIELNPDLAGYCEKLVEGVRSNLAAIDDAICLHLTDYSLDRVASVDRNVIRIATYEFYHEPAIPPAVTLNEAIEIAKKYSTAESGRFVNGVLGRILPDSPKENWDPSTAPPEEIESKTESVPEVVVEEEIGPEEAAEVVKNPGWKIRTEVES